MSKQQKENEVRIYVIPPNFIESGRIINGMFKTRNFVEALIVAAIIFLALNIFPFASTTNKISIMLMAILPFSLIFLLGVNDDSVTVFLKTIRQWKKNRKIMLYNRNAEAQKKRAVDILMKRELPRDKIVRIYTEWKNQRAVSRSTEDFLNRELYEITDDPLTKTINAEAEKENSADTAKEHPVSNNSATEEKDNEREVLHLQIDENAFSTEFED